MKIDDSTVFAGVYGSFRPHAWIDAAQMTDDAYSLFAARAASMGWASYGAADTGPVLWGMNDAGQDWNAATSRVAWFQVGVAEPGHEPRPLPIQPVLTCARDTLARVGTLNLSSVSLLLPLAAAGSSTEHLVSGRNWFSTSDPAARTAVHLTVEPGEVDAVRPVATTILESLQRLDTGPFAVETLLPGSRAVVPVPPVVDDLWLGSGRHPVTLACSTPEWSIDAVGWLVGVVAAACTAAGVRTSVLVSAVRAGSAAA